MSSNYEDKKKQLFDCLSSAEKCIQGTSLEQSQFARDEPSSEEYQPVIKKRFHGKESIFKRPEAPISKCLLPRRVPDYQKNPHKWKKYSLDEADISDRTNASAAFAFLAEIEKRKDVEEEKQSMENEMDTDDNSSGKMVFRKQRNSHRKPAFNQSASLRKEVDVSDESGERAILKGSKVVMPEYVIGKKAPKKSRTRINDESSTDTKKSDGQKKPHLQHLFDEEEEDDD